jgi:hypothetical protein
MDLHQKLFELINLIQDYQRGAIRVGSLNELAWDLIDFFESAKDDDLPERCEFEREFWYAIWQIQHLAGEGDEELFKRELDKTLGYLKKEKMIPTECEGRRPQPKSNPQANS